MIGRGIVSSIILFHIVVIFQISISRLVCCVLVLMKSRLTDQVTRGQQSFGATKFRRENTTKHSRNEIAASEQNVCTVHGAEISLKSTLVRHKTIIRTRLGVKNRFQS